MAKTQHVCLDEVVGYFDELEDPRSSINQKHPLVSVVVIAMMAVLGGAGGPTAIARWAKLKPEAFQRCFVSWLQSLRDDAAEATEVGKPILTVDGKTLRRSHDRKNSL